MHGDLGGGIRFRLSSLLRLPVYQNQSHLSGSQNDGVEEKKLSYPGDFESLALDSQDGTPTVEVDPSNTNFFHALDLSSEHLILFLVAVAVLITVIFWFLEDIGERFERLQSRFGRWRHTLNGDRSQMRLVEFPLANDAMQTLDTEVDVENLQDHDDSTTALQRNALLESEPVETFEAEQDDQPNKCDVAYEPSHGHQEERGSLDAQNESLKDLPSNEPKASETSALKKDLAQQADELATLKDFWEQKNKVSLQDAESRYQNLADDLEASRLAQSQLQTDLANANLSLESLTTKNSQFEQEKKTAYQELEGRENVVGQLESKIASSESITKSLEEKLKRAQSDLENQVEQTLVAESEIEKIENDARQWKQQLDKLREEQRNGEALESDEVKSLTAKLAERSCELETLQTRLDKAATGADEKQTSLEEAEVRCEKLVEELAELRRAQDESQSELATAKEEVLSLISKAKQAEDEVETAFQEMQNKDDLAAGLQKENEQLKSTLQSVEEQLATVKTDAKKGSDSEEAIHAQLKAETERFEQSKHELEFELDSARQKIIKLQDDVELSKSEWFQNETKYTEKIEILEFHLEETAGEKQAQLAESEKLNSIVAQSRSELTQEAAKHAEKIEILEFRLEETAEEKRAQLAENENLNSMVVQAQSDLAAAQAEITELKTELADSIASAEQIVALQDQLEDSNAQTNVTLTQIDSLTSEIKKLKNQLDLKTGELDEASKSRAKHDDQWAELGAQSKLLEQRALEAERELAKTVESLAKQQASYAELETVAKQDHDELTLQISNYSELQASAESLENQMLAAQRELSETANLLEQEKSTREKVENTVKQQAEELIVVSSGKSNIEAELNPLKMRAQKAEQQLEDSVKSLEEEQTKHAEVAKKARDAEAELTSQVAKYSELEADAESFENQMLAAQRELSETANLLEQEKSTREQIEDTVKQQAEELNALSSGKSNVEAELKPLKMRAQKAEQQLEDSVIALEQEQAKHAEVAKEARDADTELETQRSRCLELETRLKSIESQFQEADEALEQTTNELDRTKSLQLELEKTSQQQQSQLSQKEIQYAELESKLRETVESNVNESAVEDEKLERQRVELDELQTRLENEKAQHQEVLEELKTSQLRIAELEQESQAASVNESNYKVMAKKLVKYKTAYRESEARVEGLAEQKSEMSDLATEYLAVGKFLREKLDAQLAISAELKQRLDNVSSNAGNSSEFNKQVQERARNHVLKLKADFEERIKEKNKIIRKLKEQEPIQS